MDRVRSAGKRFAEPVESMTQAVARRATELVVDSLDVNALIGQIDLNRVLDRVDVDRIVARVDVEALLSRVDVNALADRIDMAALLESTELYAIVARSSSTIFSEGADLLRSQAVGLDDFLARWVNRLLGRGTKRPPAPLGPRSLMSVQAPAMTPGPRTQTGLWGHYAGAVSRFVAYAVDLGVITGVFMLTLAAASFAVSLVSGHAINWNKGDVAVAIAYGCWWLLYFGYSWAANGKTFGMALLGIRVVSSEGEVAGPRRAIVRTLVFPLSFLLSGLGLAGILLGHERRALHDVVAGTAVVYIWHARAARLRYLARDDLIPAVLPGGDAAQ